MGPTDQVTTCTEESMRTVNNNYCISALSMTVNTSGQNRIVSVHARVRWWAVCHGREGIE